MERAFSVLIERDAAGCYVATFPALRGCQAETLEELNANFREVIAMLLEDGEPVLDAEFVGT